ncbi:hypothetical protein LGR54_17545 [Ancylobacter sp. Lp-2]|uniref:hypothetical protein n=1 Tax=Ancylobacter sp. Lp-2 TaxID=2881339 RepID=UPI001E58586A|nr:hypothetical protein [Ancylobacter sp. Lp-2]MCB4770416.1 hypothetical protein [Ancylobacter sp. Lp-2]
MPTPARRRDRDGDYPTRAGAGTHRHGKPKSRIYEVRGRARMRWRDRLDMFTKAEPGDVLVVPPYVPHQEIDAGPNESPEGVLSGFPLAA